MLEQEINISTTKPDLDFFNVTSKKRRGKTDT